MGCDQNFRESRVNMISIITICMKREIRELQFVPFSVILSEKFVSFDKISREITEITRISRQLEFTT